jgi:hypothetical protein
MAVLRLCIVPERAAARWHVRPRRLPDPISPDRASARCSPFASHLRDLAGAPGRRVRLPGPLDPFTGGLRCSWQRRERVKASIRLPWRWRRDQLAVAPVPWKLTGAASRKALP